MGQPHKMLMNKAGNKIRERRGTRYGAKIENQARDIVDQYRTPLVEEKRVMLEKRATEKGKIAKKAITDGISVLKSNENNPTDVVKEAMQVMTESAKKKVIKKTKGWIQNLVVVLVPVVVVVLLFGYCLYKKRN